MNPIHTANFVTNFNVKQDRIEDIEQFLHNLVVCICMIYLFTISFDLI